MIYKHSAVKKKVFCSIVAVEIWPLADCVFLWFVFSIIAAEAGGGAGCQIFQHHPRHTGC